MDRRNNGFRFDFVQEIVRVDEEAHTATFSLRPDPRRYRLVAMEGGHFYHDILDDVYFPKQLVAEMIGQALTMQPRHQPQTLGNAFDYYERRKPVVERLFRLRHVPFEPTDKSAAFLEDLAEDRLNFVILSLDVVGSTKLATMINGDDFRLLMSVLSYEISEIVGCFSGYVLKYTGDGVIAYFPEPITNEPLCERKGNRRVTYHEQGELLGIAVTDSFHYLVVRRRGGWAIGCVYRAHYSYRCTGMRLPCHIPPRKQQRWRTIVDAI